MRGGVYAAGVFALKRIADLESYTRVVNASKVALSLSLSLSLSLCLPHLVGWSSLIAISCRIP